MIVQLMTMKKALTDWEQLVDCLLALLVIGGYCGHWPAHSLVIHQLGWMRFPG